MVAGALATFLVGFTINSAPITDIKRRANRKCAGLIFKDRARCQAEYKVNAFEELNKEMENNKEKECDKSDNPARCKKVIEKNIKFIEKLIAKENLVLRRTKK